MYGFRNDFAIFNMHYTIIQLKRVLKIISCYNLRKKNILFLGSKKIFNDKKSKINFSDILNGTPHNFLIQSLWVRGLLFNFKKVIKNLNIKLSNLYILNLNNEKSNFLKKFSGILKMKQLPRLIVILDDFLLNEILTEASKLKIPLICFLDGKYYFDSINYKICGNFFYNKTLFLKNFIFRILFNILKY